MKMVSQVTTKMYSFIGYNIDYIYIGKCPINNFDKDLLARNKEPPQISKKQSWNVYNVFGYGIQQMYFTVYSLYSAYFFAMIFAIAMMIINATGNNSSQSFITSTSLGNLGQAKSYCNFNFLSTLNETNLLYCNSGQLTKLVSYGINAVNDPIGVNYCGLAKNRENVS